MKHTNLFLYETEEDFLADYPDGKMNEPVPGVAYIRGEAGELGTLHVNRDITTYEITIHSTDKSGVTVAEDYTVETPAVLDGNEVKMNIVAEEIEGYKPRYAIEKATFSGNAAYTVIYLAATSYTVTVNHVCSGETIASATTIEIDDVYEEDVVRVKVEPLIIPGYTAEPVFISVSGDMTYNLEYEKSSGPLYEFVDLGLPSGTLWATCNMGASSPEEYGDYYAWGELETKTAYTENNYRFSDGQGGYTKYAEDSGEVFLDEEDDVAAVIIGDGEAHMPTFHQLQELINPDNTTTAWTTVNGVAGLQITPLEQSLPSIFFPATGVKSDDQFYGDGTMVIIYTCGLYDGAVDTLLGTENDGAKMVEGNDAPPRHIGIPARAVKGGTDPEPDPGPQ